jgi:hypothetical protein
MLLATAAQATETFQLNYTFTFNRGAAWPPQDVEFVVSGKFTGDRNGDIITNLHFLDFTFKKEGTYVAPYVHDVQVFPSGFNNTPSISFSGTKNNFLFYAGDVEFYSPSIDPNFTFFKIALTTYFDWPYYYYEISDQTINSSWSVVAVPEPETYGMFLAGLGLMAFALRRRKL